MAYFSQDDKKRLSPQIKAVLKKYGVRGSISVANHSSLVVTLKEGKLDFIGTANKRNSKYAERNNQYNHQIKDYYQVNPYYCADWARDVNENEIANFFEELVAAMKGAGWYDNSDAQIDYFDTAYYIDINVGKYNKPYNFVG